MQTGVDVSGAYLLLARQFLVSHHCGASARCPWRTVAVLQMHQVPKSDVETLVEVDFFLSLMLLEYD